MHNCTNCHQAMRSIRQDNRAMTVVASFSHTPLSLDENMIIQQALSFLVNRVRYMFSLFVSVAYTLHYLNSLSVMCLSDCPYTLTAYNWVSGSWCADQDRTYE